MAYKYYGRTVFSCEIKGRKYSFTCFGQDTRYGFRHVCFEGDDIYYPEYAKSSLLNKCCYYNRTWECFQYQTVLHGAINKLDIDEETKQALKTILIDRKEIEVKEEAEAWTKDFEATYNSLSDKNKEILKNTPHIETQEQAQGVLNTMKLMLAFEQLGL